MPTSRHKTGFLDLPCELQDMIFAHALEGVGRKKIGFRYDCEYAAEYIQRQEKQRRRSSEKIKPPHHGIYAPDLSSDEVIKVRSARWKEKLPPLAYISGVPQEEVLTIHYSLNSFKCHLRNFLDRRLCVEWIHTRGAALKNLKSFESFDLHISRSAGGRAPIREYRSAYNYPHMCACSFLDWFNKYRDTDIARGLYGHKLHNDLSEHGVAGTLLRVCELLQAADHIHLAKKRNFNGGGFKGMWKERFYPHPKCGICGTTGTYPASGLQAGLYRTVQ